MYQMSTRCLQIVSAGFLSVVLSACASTPKITRTAVDEQIDLSGNWNDTDSRLVSEEMIRDALNRPWKAEFVSQHNKKPRLIVGTIVNRSHEHINTQTFVKDLERELTNSGQVRFVASKAERGEIREEREDQAVHSRTDTAKSMGKEYGADFMLKGQINTIMDAAGKRQLKYYQIELELIDLESNEKVWIGQKKIKKLVKSRKFKF